MDRKQLAQIKKELEGFILHIGESAHKLEYACLIPAYENERNSPLILQVHADWIEQTGCYKAISIVVNYLFKSTTAETRKSIYRIDIYNENGDLHCTSDEYILVGQTPALIC